MNFLKEHWEYPACTRCAHCHQPLILTWSSSAVNQHIYHGACRRARIDQARRRAQQNFKEKKA